MSTHPTSPMSVLFGRVFWMTLGPMLLCASLLIILLGGEGWATAADLCYFVVLGLMIAGRWLEFHAGDPHRATGEPADPADLRRYVWGAVGLGVPAWALANLVGNHLLRL